MNYKIITYNCKCKYIFITDHEKRILKKAKLCPIHGKLRKHVVLWCQDCGLKITETGPLSWQRKTRCEKCRRTEQRRVNLANWKKKAVKYNAKRRKFTMKTKSEYSRIALAAACKKRSLQRFYKSINIVLPVVETPTLDKMCGEV